jgi:hypothetical protein
VDSVTSLNVAARGDGAEVYCVANKSVYRYSASSTQTTIGDTFLVPLSGGGCWFKQNAQSDYTVGFDGTTAHFAGSAFLVTAVVGTWVALPTGTNFYEAFPTSLMWSLNTTTGVFTYNGPSGLKFSMQANLSFSKNTLGTPIAYDLNDTINGALIGTVGALATSTSEFISGSSGIYANFSMTDIISPNSGDTVQHMIRRVTAAAGSGSETFSHYTVVINQV